ncbi:MAG: hypothetical protein IPJ08_14195 [Burkholderiales bacterium]|nr:hypothetical protein [Burkholderiales bacterium]
MRKTFQAEAITGEAAAFDVPLGSKALAQVLALNQQLLAEPEPAPAVARALAGPRHGLATGWRGQRACC